MDVGTIALALLAVGALALFLVVVRRLPPAEDDVAAVVAAVMGTPFEPERPSPDLEEPVQWRLDLLRPRAADRPNSERSAAPLASDSGVPRLATRPHSMGEIPVLPRRAVGRSTSISAPLD